MSKPLTYMDLRRSEKPELSSRIPSSAGTLVGVVNSIRITVCPPRISLGAEPTDDTIYPIGRPMSFDDYSIRRKPRYPNT